MGMIEGPNMAAIYLRAGWTLGQVQDRYIFHGAGADQYCGRVACCLDTRKSEEFCALPPRFRSSNLISDEEYSNIIPNYQSFPITFQRIIPYLIAHIVFHYEWIIEKDSHGEYLNVNKHHPIHTSRIMTLGIIVQSNIIL